VWRSAGPWWIRLHLDTATLSLGQPGRGLPGLGDAPGILQPALHNEVAGAASRSPPGLNNRVRGEVGLDGLDRGAERAEVLHRVVDGRPIGRDQHIETLFGAA
jgi:hypothetical protein